jgi:hypothetical protein
VQSRQALSPRIIADLARQPLWLTAVGANIAGFALQVVALNYGSLALVQPIVALDLMFAVLILWYLRRANWPIYLLAVVGPAGYILNQDAFQQGTLLAPVQAIISAADPVISIALGVGWLAVRLRGGPAATAGEVISLLLLTAGIVMTAYHVPQTGDAGAPPATGQGYG